MITISYHPYCIMDDAMMQNQVTDSIIYLGDGGMLIIVSFILLPKQFPWLPLSHTVIPLPGSLLPLVTLATCLHDCCYREAYI